MDFFRSCSICYGCTLALRDLPWRPRQTILFSWNVIHYIASIELPKSMDYYEHTYEVIRIP